MINGSFEDFYTVDIMNDIDFVELLITRLFGETVPIGESNYDKKCKDNIEKYKTLIEDLLDSLEYLIGYKDRPFASMKAVGEKAESVLSQLKNRLGEILNDDT